MILSAAKFRHNIKSKENVLASNPWLCEQVMSKNVMYDYAFVWGWHPLAIQDFGIFFIQKDKYVTIPKHGTYVCQLSRELT